MLMGIKIEKKKRIYFSENFKIEEWVELEKILKEMLNVKIESADDLVSFIEKYSELGGIISEAGAWKTIRMTQHADDGRLAKEQAQFYEKIAAPAQPYFFELDRKVCQSEFFKELSSERYSHLGAILDNEISLFRFENIPLGTKENELANKYAEIYSKIAVEFEGKTLTIEEADLILQDKDRGRREKAWRAAAGKVIEKKEEFEKLFDDLKEIRVRMASNAGFGNYRDYIHKSYDRFDYTPEDLYDFHAAVEAVAVPAMRKINEDRRKKLSVDKLRPWDMLVDMDGKTLKPFSDAEELFAGSLRILSRVDPQFRSQIEAMSDYGLLDLSNRKGKAPGGYNCSLDELGASFIFMNAVGTQRDVQTLLHESGHALHEFAVDGEKIIQYRNPPKEVSELASVSMELFMLDYLDEFYKNEADIKKAKREQLKDALSVFPSVAVGDAFQHWIYLNPDHSSEERDEEFSRLKSRFDTGVDWSGLEKERAAYWLRILHFFEVPFYYVEYAIAQLGAIALYKHFKENPHKAIENYKNFMRLGYSKSVPEIYKAAGIKFDFSKEYLEEMIGFVMEELEELER